MNVASEKLKTKRSERIAVWVQYLQYKSSLHPVSGQCRLLFIRKRCVYATQ